MSFWLGGMILIVSASRRTDIPAFYAEWFINRIHEQYCTVSNPFNRNQVARVSLKPVDVDAIVFWTKNATPLMPHLDRLNQMGYRYYFQYTVNGYGTDFEQKVPPLSECIGAFRELADRIGPEKVVWRYDPILISNKTGIDYHKERFAYILEQLHQATHRVVISIHDAYRKASGNFQELNRSGIEVRPVRDIPEVSDLIKYIVERCAAKNIEVFSCAETFDFSGLGINAGKCIDDELINKLFGIQVKPGKDKSQRKECGCVSGKDIGCYDTCLHGCMYCYAGTLKAGQTSFRKHQPASASMNVFSQGTDASMGFDSI